MSSTSPSTLLDYRREDEERLQYLKRQIDSNVELNSQERDEFLLLQKKEAFFHQEGIRNLTRAAEMKHTEQETSLKSTLTNAITGLAKGTLFWGSFGLGTVAPACLGSVLGLSDVYKHWNWITDDLILGALPIVTQVGTSWNHLEMLGKQCAERNTRIGLVVSALTSEEINGFGIKYPQFATHDDWRSQLKVHRFELLEITDLTAHIEYEAVLHAIEKMQIVISDAKEAVYVHCKAGKGRSWMIMMCFLCTFRCMSFDDADNLIRQHRPQVNPSQAQVSFVKDFVKRYSASEAAQKLLASENTNSAAAGRIAAEDDDGWEKDCYP